MRISDWSSDVCSSDRLLGAENGVLGEDLGVMGEVKPEEVVWRDDPADGKLDLMVTIDFRMNTTGLFSDIVLPTATWYEKNDLRSEEHTSELQSLMRISYAVFCLKKKHLTTIY